MRKLILAVLLLCASLAAYGQGSTLLFQPATDQNGNFLSFATVTFCSIPTTINTFGVCQTPITVFQDQGLNTPYSSGILTDGIGFFPPNAKTATSLWFAPGTYCYTLTTSNMQSPATNPCTPFTVSIVPGSSPSFVSVTLSGNANLASASVICWNSDSGITRAAAKSFKMGDCAGSSDGTLTLGNLTLSNAGTLLVNNIKQQAGASFLIADPNGISHFFISNSAPYTNTFVQGSGSGSVFLGSAAKAAVSDTTGAVTTAGGLTLQNTSQLLPATIANDATGGITFTNNAGGLFQFGNAGTLFLGSNTQRGQKLEYFGSASGVTDVQASAAAGNNLLTLPATVNDTLVAKTTTDTLTNKNLITATSGNTVTLLNWQGAAGAITGTGADATVYSFSIPGNTLQAGKGIKVSVGWQHTTGAANVTYKCKFGATTVSSNAESGTGASALVFYVMNNPGSTSAQTAWQEPRTNNAVVYTTQFATPAENATGAITVAFTFSVANTDQVTPKLFLVELIQ